jgi:hypothetical protein
MQNEAYSARPAGERLATLKSQFSKWIVASAKGLCGSDRRKLLQFCDGVGQRMAAS